MVFVQILWPIVGFHFVVVLSYSSEALPRHWGVQQGKAIYFSFSSFYCWIQVTFFSLFLYFTDVNLLCNPVLASLSLCTAEKGVSPKAVLEQNNLLDCIKYRNKLATELCMTIHFFNRQHIYSTKLVSPYHHPMYSGHLHQ